VWGDDGQKIDRRQGSVAPANSPDFHRKWGASDRFRPSDQDENMLSLDRSLLVTPSESHANYVAGGRLSVAVFGLSVSEFESETIPCSEDPLEATATSAANPAHSVADYSAQQKKQQKIIGKKLQRVAIARGRLHPPI
jgi:hypothetical protein